MPTKRWCFAAWAMCGVDDVDKKKNSLERDGSGDVRGLILSGDAWVGVGDV